MKRTMVFFCLLLAITPPAWSMTDAEAVNISGSLRMLSQRMMKNYVAIGAGIRPDIAMRQLDDSVALFEQRFRALQDYARSESVRRELQAVESIWLLHRQQLVSAPDKQRAAQLLQDNRQLLQACNRAVEAIARDNGQPGAELVNIAGRQRMLSQRIAKTYFALYWNMADDTLKREFHDAVTLFETSLQQLLNSPLNTADIRQALQQVESQWQFSRSGFALDADGRYVPTIISVTTESILWKMDAITALYEGVMNGG